jgi:hypothetical protein
MFTDHQVRAFRQYLAVTPPARRNSADCAAFVRRSSSAGAYDSRPPDGDVLVTVAGGKSTMPVFGRDDRAETEPHGGGVREIKGRAPTATEVNTRERPSVSDQEGEGSRAIDRLLALLQQIAPHDRARVEAALTDVLDEQGEGHRAALEKERGKGELYEYLRRRGMAPDDCKKAVALHEKYATDRKIDEHLALDAIARGHTRTALARLKPMSRQAQDAVFSRIVGFPVRTFSEKQERRFAEMFPGIPMRRVW